MASMRISACSSSAGNPRGLIEARGRAAGPERCASSSAGNPRGLIEALRRLTDMPRRGESSAGNPRGLIEARVLEAPGSSAGNPRGLIEAWHTRRVLSSCLLSSAGNPRGLIEAPRPRRQTEGRSASSAGNPRGLIEACGTGQAAGPERCTSSAGNRRDHIQSNSERADVAPCPARETRRRGSTRRPT